MAALASTFARIAITQVLEGTLGTARRLEQQVFKSGVFAGQPMSTKQSVARQTAEGRHRFEVNFGRARDNGATSVASTGSRRIADWDVRISGITSVATVAQLVERDDVMDGLYADLEDAIQALETPGNLSATASGDATTVASGLMRGPTGTGSPEYRILREDWDKQLLEWEISGLITLTVPMND